MDDLPNDRVVVEINVEAREATSTVDYTAEEWAQMSPLHRGLLLEDAVDTEISNAGGAGWCIVSGPASDADVQTPPTKRGLLDDIERLREAAQRMHDRFEEAVREYHDWYGHPGQRRDCEDEVCVEDRRMFDALGQLLKPPAVSE